MSDHPIEDLSFNEGWLCCACGEFVEGEKPDELAAAYRAHRASRGAERVVLSDSKHQRGTPFTLRASHQEGHRSQDDQIVGYLMDARPLA